MKRRIHRYRFIGLDFITAFAAWVIFYFTRKYLLQETPADFDFTLFWHALALGIFWVGFYWFFGFYNEIFRKSRIKEFFWVLTASFLGSILIFFVLLLDDQGVKADYTRYYKTFISYYLIQFSLTIIFKIALITYIKRLVKSKKLYFNALIIGSGPKAIEIHEEIEKSYEQLGLRFLGHVPISPDKGQYGTTLRSLGNLDNLSRLIRRCYVEQVVLAVEKDEHDKVETILQALNETSAQISIIPDIYQYLIGTIKVNHSFDLPLLDINQELMPPWQSNLKRISDIIVSLLVLGLGFPFFLLVGIITKLSSPGPVFFRQERIGKEGKPFKIIKFRSMYQNAEAQGPRLAKTGDNRITGWGRFMRKTRLDEFPQFYNVLVGDMSLVGPRPERQFFIDQIVKIAPYYKNLHKVRPGITSLGQVKFGYAENVDEMIKRLKYDILYIENMSFAMDLRIILYTILIMFQGRGK